MKQNNFIIKYIYMKNLYLYLILALIAIYFYCYQYHSCSFVEGYRNAKVFIGENPSFSRNNILFIDDDQNFGSDSIYETGRIRNPNAPNDNNVYGSTFGNVYGTSYSGYYDYS